MTILDGPCSDTKWNSTRGGVNGGIRIETAFDAEIKILPMKIFKKEVEEKEPITCDTMIFILVRAFSKGLLQYLSIPLRISTNHWPCKPQGPLPNRKVQSNNPAAGFSHRPENEGHHPLTWAHNSSQHMAITSTHIFSLSLFLFLTIRIWKCSTHSKTYSLSNVVEWRT